ncbi:uncharacterized protein TRIADDRAFT_51641 [Trichoplax adhaerens]|uniref:WW domain-containing protein n=1 Tax=Trichoplax adhaerens TaxID=10228 RepID=B3RKD5_TRIAD|nr:predicted protein [Trichoplax adhaerens]EDV29386.1 predicted protein [Trichoplax adhaerens]|eukprot:XP_002108588.1 predicted protein [Trichoplax adhaerens]
MQKRQYKSNRRKILQLDPGSDKIDANSSISAMDATLEIEETNIAGLVSYEDSDEEVKSSNKKPLIKQPERKDQIAQEVASFMLEIDAMEQDTSDDQNLRATQPPKSTEIISTSFRSLDKTDDKAIWLECYDQNSNSVYYWNTENNKVSWVLPENAKVQSALSQLYQDHADDIKATISDSDEITGIEETTNENNVNKESEIDQARKKRPIPDNNTVTLENDAKKRHIEACEESHSDKGLSSDKITDDIIEASLRLRQKLDVMGVQKLSISDAQIALIQLEIRFNDWQKGVLNGKYFLERILETEKSFHKPYDLDSINSLEDSIESPENLEKQEIVEEEPGLEAADQHPDDSQECTPHTPDISSVEEGEIIDSPPSSETTVTEETYNTKDVSDSVHDSLPPDSEDTTNVNTDESCYFQFQKRTESPVAPKKKELGCIYLPYSNKALPKYDLRDRG